MSNEKSRLFLAQSGYYPQAQTRHTDTSLSHATVIVLVVIMTVLGSITALGFLVATRSTTTGTLESQIIVNGQIIIEPEHHVYYWVTTLASATSLSIGGSFVVSGGNGSYLEVLVMNEANFGDWSNGRPAYAYYDSGQVTMGTVDASLPGPGKYYLVYYNSSTVSSKTVQTTVRLYYRP